MIPGLDIGSLSGSTGPIKQSSEAKSGSSGSSNTGGTVFNFGAPSNAIPWANIIVGLVALAAVAFALKGK